MKKRMPPITRTSQEELHRLFFYNCETGVFTRKAYKLYAATGHRLGMPVGFVDVNGYVKIKVSGDVYLAHRLAWLYVYGEWPKQHIDHIDGNRSYNAISNLRDVSYSENGQNQRKATARNRFSNLLGVSPSSRVKNPWVAQICIDGKSKHLGTFKTADLAHQAYLEAKRELHVACEI